jgi:hypothetical protein
MRTYTRWLDARILVAWAKLHEVPLTAFITKVSIFNYTWAKDTPSDFVTKLIFMNFTNY